MKLTAKLLKKIIRESINKGGIRGIRKYYADEDERLDSETAKQAAELSGMLGSDIEAEDVDESIFIEVKEIMADFIQQFYNSLLTNPSLNGSYRSQLLDLDEIYEAARKRIDSIIDGSYYVRSNLYTNIAVSAIMMAMHKNRSIRPQAKKLRMYIKKMRESFSSYDDLMSKLPPELQEVLKQLKIERRINDQLDKLAEATKAQKSLKMQPVSNYQNYIRLANSKKEVANIMELFNKHIHELKDFLIKHFEGAKESLSRLLPHTFVIDPEMIQYTEDGIDYRERGKVIFVDKNRQQKSFMDIINEVEEYVSPRISGDFVDRYADPRVKQKFLPKKFPMTEAALKDLIYEELSSLMSEQEDEDFTKQFEVLFSSDADKIIQGLRLADSLGLTPEELPFEKLDLSKQNIPDPADLLRVAETALDTYGDYIVSYLRKKLIAAMEKGLRRRLEAGMTTGLNHPSDRIRKIIKNELTSHKRKINVIGTPKSK